MRRIFPTLSTAIQAGQDSREDARKAAGFAALAQSILGGLETLACDSAVTVPPEALLPAVQATLDSVQGIGSDGRGTPLDAEARPVGAWRTLADHLCSDDEWAAALGSSWLLSLLLAAAERYLASGASQPIYSLDTRSSDGCKAI